MKTNLETLENTLEVELREDFENLTKTELIKAIRKAKSIKLKDAIAHNICRRKPTENQLLKVYDLTEYPLAYRMLFYNATYEEAIENDDDW